MYTRSLRGQAELAPDNLLTVGDTAARAGHKLTFDFVSNTFSAVRSAEKSELYVPKTSSGDDSWRPGLGEGVTHTTRDRGVKGLCLPGFTAIEGRNTWEEKDIGEDSPQLSSGFSRRSSCEWMHDSNLQLKLQNFQTGGKRRIGAFSRLLDSPILYLVKAAVAISAVFSNFRQATTLLGKSQGGHSWLYNGEKPQNMLSSTSGLSTFFILPKYDPVVLFQYQLPYNTPGWGLNGRDATEHLRLVVYPDVLPDVVAHCIAQEVKRCHLRPPLNIMLLAQIQGEDP
ncbi:hypothetical protein B0H11DRAFT_2333430 [Mycena galericulata]|nr:hypothetical protein B0H11DRAFT_2333430 [Mycena galericulata]